LFIVYAIILKKPCILDVSLLYKIQITMNKNSLLKKIDDIKKKANMLLYKIDKSNENKSEISKDDFEKAYVQLKENEEIISENYKTISEQLQLIEELTHLKENIQLASYSEELIAIMDYDTYFDLTIENEIDFNEEHPYFKNIKFIKQLIDSYIKTEEYEKCAYLMKLMS